MKKNILFIIPDGIGIKNYLYTNLLNEILKIGNVSLLTSLSQETFDDIVLKDALNIEFFNQEKETNISRICRESATFARLKYNSKKVNNPSILTNWNYNPQGFKLKIITTISQIIGNWAATKYRRIVRLEKIGKQNWKRETIDKYKSQLVEINPSVIFITHQRVMSLMPICIAANELNIKIVTVIYSWDNLPKGRLAIFADKYLVWSDYMKTEMKTYYPEINQQKIIVTGTPQFEFFLQNDKVVTREDFAIIHGLNSLKKWICFSGEDIKTSPYGEKYLADVAQAISNLPYEQQPHIIFRRAPVDFSNRYDKVLNEFKNQITPINPVWYVPGEINSWGNYFPKIEDVAMLINIAYHCEIVINLGSTMAHDFAVYNKPCLYINYEAVISKSWSVKTCHEYQHFRSMESKNEVGWINNKEEILEKILFTLKNPNEIAVDRLKWLQKIVLHPLDAASINIAKELLTEN